MTTGTYVICIVMLACTWMIGTEIRDARQKIGSHIDRLREEIRNRP